jgi:hypothetical protein
MHNVKFPYPAIVGLEGHEIKKRLGHGCVSRIAAQTGRTIGHVSQVINGLRRDRKVEVATARKLRMKVDEVFPTAT